MSDSPELKILVELAQWLAATEQLDEYVLKALLDFARMRGLDLDAALNRKQFG